MFRPRRLLLAALVAALMGGAWGSAGAQATASSFFGSSVDILYPPLTGVGLRPLDFGVLIPTAGAVTVQPNATNAAEFRIRGTKTRKSIDITLTLPAVLTKSGGTATIPLNFNGNFAALCEIDTTNTCNALSYFAWNPVTTPTYHDLPTRYKGGRKVYAFDDYSVYVGGIATPAATQAAGTYVGTITATVVVN